MQLLQRKLFYLSKIWMEGISFGNLFWKKNKTLTCLFSLCISGVTIQTTLCSAVWPPVLPGNRKSPTSKLERKCVEVNIESLIQYRWSWNRSLMLFLCFWPFSVLPASVALRPPASMLRNHHLIFQFSLCHSPYWAKHSCTIFYDPKTPCVEGNRLLGYYCSKAIYRLGSLTVDSRAISISTISWSSF